MSLLCNSNPLKEAIRSYKAMSPKPKRTARLYKMPPIKNGENGVFFQKIKRINKLIWNLDYGVR